LNKNSKNNLSVASVHSVVNYNKVFHYTKEYQSGHMNRTEIISWLLESDPVIRWQVMRDLLDAEEPAYTLERERLTQEGWAARLLALQDKDGL
jgi:hypothetical protein